MTIRSSPCVYVIILNWNGLQDTKECLASLRKITYNNYRVVVVDNASNNHEAYTLRESFGFYAHVIENNENLGFTGGCNVGIEYAIEQGADYVLLLNNDTLVEPDFLDKLVETGELYSTIGIVGPKIYYGTERKRIWSAGGMIHKKITFTYKNEQDEPYNFYADRVRAFYIIGCAMLIKREVIKRIGFLDDRFFAYDEDIDYCTRAAAASYDCVLVTNSVVYHKLSASTKSNEPLREYYQTRNTYLKAMSISGRNYPAFAFAFWTLVHTRRVISYSRNNLLINRKKIPAIFWGMWDGMIVRKYGKTRRF